MFKRIGRIFGICFSIAWEPRDVWIGVYWKNSYHESFPEAVRRVGQVHWCFYVCVVPCVPILIQFFTRVRMPAK